MNPDKEEESKPPPPSLSGFIIDLQSWRQELKKRRPAHDTRHQKPRPLPQVPCGLR